MSGAFEVSSVVAGPAARVWERISTLDGVNGELAPFFRMTFPAYARDLAAADVVLGRRLFRSWILLFGVLPVDWDDVTLVRITPGVGFREESTMASQRSWVHERVLKDVPGGCRVTDRIAFTPRLPWLAPVYRAVFLRLFRHRHRRLARACAAPAHSMP